MARKRREYVVMRTWKMEMSGNRRIGRPRQRQRDVIQKNMKMTGNALHPSAYSFAISFDLNPLYY